MDFFRTLTERFSRGKTIKRNITVDGRKGMLVASPDAQLKYLKPGVNAFDQDLIKIAEQYVSQGHTV